MRVPNNMQPRQSALTSMPPSPSGTVRIGLSCQSRGRRCTMLSRAKRCYERYGFVDARRIDGRDNEEHAGRPYVWDDEQSWIGA